MPNYCENTLQLTGEKAKILDLLHKIKETKEFFNLIVPMPPELEDNEGWYDWRIANWGTKWEAMLHFDIDKAIENVTLETSQDVTVDFELFDTAWSPPIPIYEKLTKLGFYVDAYYFECGCTFYGWYEDGIETYETYSNVEGIPPEIREMFAVDEYYDDEDEEE